MTKKRNWAFVLYPESAPENWKEILQLKGLQCAISPLHDKDVNVADNEIKKSHYHIILHFDGPTSFNVVEEITKELKSTIPIPLESVRGMYRYLTHKDNPEKAQYNESDILLLNNFDVCDILNSSEVFSIMKDLNLIIEEENITEYCDLCTYLLNRDLADYYNVAISHTLFFNTYITSKRHKLEKALSSQK